MSGVTEICNSVCAVSIISGVILVLVPENKLTGAFRSVVAIILIYFAASAFMNSAYKSEDIIKMPTYEKEDMEKLYENNILSTAEELLTDDIKKLLSDNGVACSFEISLHHENDKIAETVIIKDFTDTKKKEKICQLLKNRFGDELIIEFAG